MGEMVPDALVDCAVELPPISCSLPGGSGALRNRLVMPDTTMPGCRPKRGASSEMLPRMRCRKGCPYTGLDEG